MILSRFQLSKEWIIAAFVGLAVVVGLVLGGLTGLVLSLIHISEPTRPY